MLFHDTGNFNRDLMLMMPLGFGDVSEDYFNHLCLSSNRSAGMVERSCGSASRLMVVNWSMLDEDGC